MKLVLIGGKNKLLTHNVAKALIENNYDLKLTVLRVKKEKLIKRNFLSRTIAGLKLGGISYVIDKLKKKRETSRVLNTKAYCNNNDVECIEIEDVNSKFVESSIKKINPDVIILAGPPIIKDNILSLAKLYTINIHRSLLPKYAGLDAIFWALYNDENEIGATVHTVNNGIDKGDIIIQRKRLVEKGDSLESLTDWYYEIAPGLIIEALNIIKDPNHKFIKQDLSKRKYYSRPTLKDQYELKNKLSNRV